MLSLNRRLISVFVLLLSAVSLVWSGVPARQLNLTSTLAPEDMQLVSTEINATYAVLENRQVRLEWPASMRIGDEYAINLEYTPFVNESAAPGQPSGYVDVYSDHNVMAEARYEVNGVRADPVNPIRASLIAGRGLKFTWEIQADQAGEYDSVVWLSLRYLPLDGSAPSQVPIFIQALKLHTHSLLGLDASKARLLGGLGMILAIALELGDRFGKIRGRKEKHIA